MATVRLTPARIEHLLNGITMADQKALDDVQTSWLGTDLTQALYDVDHTPRDIALANQLGPGWIAYKDRHGMYYASELGGLDSINSVTLRFQPALPFRINERNWELGDMPRDLQVEFYKRLAVFQTACDAHAKKRKAVEATLQKYKTLQQLIQAWPSVLEFCDEETQTMYHRKPTKSERVVDKLPDELLTTIAITRMTKT